MLARRRRQQIYMARPSLAINSQKSVVVRRSRRAQRAEHRAEANKIVIRSIGGGLVVFSSGIARKQ